MPDFAIVDTHVHLIEPSRHRYPELEPAPAIHKTFLPADFDRLRGDVEVERIVFLEVAVSEDHQVAEAEFADALAAEDPRIAAIVAAAPVARGAAVEATLEQLKGIDRLRGIRQLIQIHPDPEFCLRPDFIEGVRRVGEHGLHFEITIYHQQMAAALRLVQACPEVTFILDHIGKPCIRHDVIEPWWSQMKAMAALPNVTCKMSGVITEDDHERWSEAHIRPYLARVFDAFGFDRVVFGSDWPVSELTHRYADWVGILDRLLAGCSEEERRKFYRDNAIALYRLA